MTGGEQVTVNELSRAFTAFLHDDWKSFKEETLDTLKELRDDKLKRDAVAAAARDALLASNEQAKSSALDLRSKKAALIGLAGVICGGAFGIIAALISR